MPHWVVDASFLKTISTEQRRQTIAKAEPRSANAYEDDLQDVAMMSACREHTKNRCRCSTPTRGAFASRTGTGSPDHTIS